MEWNGMQSLTKELNYKKEKNANQTQKDTRSSVACGWIDLTSNEARLLLFDAVHVWVEVQLLVWSRECC